MLAKVPPFLQSSGRYAAIVLGASIPISVALDNILFFLVVLAWLAGGSLRQKLEGVRANPAALAALAFFGLLLLGMTWGIGSAREGWYFIGKYKDLVLVAALGGVIAGESDKRYALHAFLAVMALTLVLSYAMWLGLLPTDGDPHHRGPDNPAVFKLHITHGVLMAIAAFLAADRARRADDPRWQAIYGAGALLAACNVFMVQGRTGYLVFAVLAFYFCAAHWRWRGAVLAVGAAAIAIATALLIDTAQVGRLAKAGTEYREWQAGRGDDTSIGLRMNYFNTAAAIVREHPLLGVGTGGFEKAYRDKDRSRNTSEVSNNPHNQYLLTAAQLGVVGLGALLAMFGVMWWQARRLDPPARIAARGLVLAIAVGSLFNSFLIDHTEGLLFAWMAGVLFAAPRRTQ